LVQEKSFHPDKPAALSAAGNSTLLLVGAALSRDHRAGRTAARGSLP
jgi:hypothetical protein